MVDLATRMSDARARALLEVGPYGRGAFRRFATSSIRGTLELLLALPTVGGDRQPSDGR